MSRARSALLALAFVVILVILGATDALLTRSSWRMPGSFEDGVAKKGEPDVTAIVQRQGFAIAETSEPQLLRNLPVPLRLQTRVLLKDNDRVATLAWAETPDVKDVFTLLRKHLRQAFSPQMQDLIDETQTEPGKPPRDMLSFFDLALHTDRIVFVRVRQRLYELHVTAGKEPLVDGVVNALSE